MASTSSSRQWAETSPAAVTRIAALKERVATPEVAFGAAFLCLMLVLSAISAAITL